MDSMKEGEKLIHCVPVLKRNHRKVTALSQGTLNKGEAAEQRAKDLTVYGAGHKGTFEQEGWQEWTPRNKPGLHRKGLSESLSRSKALL